MLLCVLRTAAALRRTVQAATTEWPPWRDAGGIPADPQKPLGGLLAREKPRGFFLVNGPSIAARRRPCRWSGTGRGELPEGSPMRYEMNSPGHRGTVVLGAAWVALAALLAGFAAIALAYAANKPMWLDEAYALSSAIRHESPARLLLRGADNQGSPSPLDYALVRALDGARTAVRYLGLPPHAYFRLVGVLATIGAAAFAFFTALASPAGSRPSRTRGVTVLSALLAALALAAQPLVIHYAAETRPYALWLALWLVSALSLLRTTGPGRRASAVFLTLLAVTATASVFQLLALAAATFVVGMVENRPPAQLRRELLGVFALPIAACLFYCAQVGQWSYALETRAWERFVPFWAAHGWVLAASAIAVALCFMTPETRPLAVAPLGMAIFYLLSPAMFEATRLRGFFFTDRQYIGFGCTVTLVWVTLARVLAVRPVVLRDRARLAVILLAAGAAFLGTAQGVRNTVSVVARTREAWRRSGGVPADPGRVLAGLPARELPRGFCFAVPPSLEQKTNLALVADWLPVHYPSRPVGETLVQVEARGDGAEVASLGGSCGPEREVAVTRERL